MFRHLKRRPFQTRGPRQGDNSGCRRIAAGASHDKQRAIFASVSHELRTPLGGIIGMARVLLESELTGHQRQSIENIAASSEALLVIVNDILDYSKIEAGKLELHLVRFDLRKLLQDLTALLAASSGKRIDVVLHYPDGVPVWFTGDAGRIRQIVTNLVGNAIKFSRGRIGINVTARTGTTAFDLRIAVTDTGPGIPLDRIHSIFDDFVQLETSQRVAGTGLGLPISRRLARLMDGDIDATSVPGIGSTFTFAVPMAAADGLGQATPAAPVQYVRVSPRAGQPIRILAADDNKTNRMVLSSMLKDAGVDLVMACDGVEAVEMFAQTQPAMILMDLSMPGLTGFEATRQIRTIEAQRGLARTPIIALTANAVRGDRDKCLAANLDDYMSKPLQKKLLMVMIDRWSTQADLAPHPPLYDKDRRQHERAQLSIDGRRRTQHSLDQDRIAALVADLGSATAALLARQFCRDMEEALIRLEAGVTASNSAEVQLTLSMIRSCAANLGIIGIVQACDTMRRALEAGQAADACELGHALTSAKLALGGVLS